MGGRRSGRDDSLRDVAHHRVSPPRRRIPPDARRIFEPARAPRAAPRASDPMRGVDARPLRVRGFGRYVRSRVLRATRRRRARRGCDATRVMAKERGRRRRADGVERPARGVRQRRIRGRRRRHGRRRRGRSTSRLAAVVPRRLAGGKAHVFAARRFARRAVRARGGAGERRGGGVVPREPRRRRRRVDGDGRAERAGGTARDRAVAAGVSQGRARGGHRRGARGDGGGGRRPLGRMRRASGDARRVRPAIGPVVGIGVVGPVVARLAHRAGGSHAVVGISRRDGSIAVFLRQGRDARRGGVDE